jgi:hypothetical protein
LRLETQRVNTFNRAAMDTGLEDWNPLMRYQRQSWEREMCLTVKSADCVITPATTSSEAAASVPA